MARHAQGSHRLTAPLQPPQEEDDAALAVDASLLGIPDDGVPSAARLLRAGPLVHAGYLRKKRERCLGLCTAVFPPQWPTRLFIIAGRFLYRFTSEQSRRPKGCPIPLESADFRLINDEVFSYCFMVSTLSKEVVLAADTAEERRAWLERLRVAKQRAIKESMGHAVEQPEVAPLNKMGAQLWKRKLRRWAEGQGAHGAAEPATLEMRTLSSGGGFVDPLH